MKFATKSFLKGFGSVLSLCPSEITNLSKLRQTHLPADYQLGPLGGIGARKAYAEAIRRAVERMVHSSTELDRDLKSFSRGTKVRSEGTRRIDSAWSDPRQTVKIKLHRAGTASEPSRTFAAYSDSLDALGDMLSIRGDWEKISHDVVSAREMLTGE